MIHLTALRDSLKASLSDEERLSLLSPFAEPRSLGALSIEEKIAVKQVVAIGQGKAVFPGRVSPKKLLEMLVEVDHFYREIGGLVGYQLEILHLLEGTLPPSEWDEVHYHSPNFIDISKETPAVEDLIRKGIEALPFLVEMIPLGGAADRLHLTDEKTGLELPAAKLPFAGRTLLESLFRDLEAKEHLFWRLTGKKIVIPVAMMTSHEKDNHRHVQAICEKNRWFGRPKELFRFFTQPLVPTVCRDGSWCMAGPRRPLLKPSGHGAMWKLAKDKGIFSWFASLGKTHALIRQINNPIAGIDYGLLAFIGAGYFQKQVFGFASCPRLLQAAEGVNVVIERKRKGRKESILTNIEYCDFKRYGIEDEPLVKGDPYSRYSANTNILFADLSAVEKAVAITPFPGLLVNLKKNGQGIEVARLESTMQNIADVFVDGKTFITYNDRAKTISTAKKAHLPNGSYNETPEKCFYDQQGVMRTLLQDTCNFSLPKRRILEEMLSKGPECLFLAHPSLGPLFSLIGHKLQKGTLFEGCALEIELSEVLIETLSLKGSLKIDGSSLGQCILKEVAIENKGIHWQSSCPVWKGNWIKEESVEIHFEGAGEFIAEKVFFHGSHRFLVKANTQMIVREVEGCLSIEERPFTPRSLWNYQWDKETNKLHIQSTQKTQKEASEPLPLAAQ